jgi:hypothetical protein
MSDHRYLNVVDAIDHAAGLVGPVLRVRQLIIEGKVGTCETVAEGRQRLLKQHCESVVRAGRKKGENEHSGARVVQKRSGVLHVAHGDVHVGQRKSGVKSLQLRVVPARDVTGQDTTQGRAVSGLL